MHSIHVQHTIDVPYEQAWDALNDFGGVFRYNPSVEQSRLIGDVPTGEGAERECRFYGGGVIKERISQYEAGKGYTIQIIDSGPFPLKEAEGYIGVEPDGAGRSRMTFRFRFLPKYGPLGWIMGITMMKPQFRKVGRRIFQGLEDHLRTGKVVGKGGVLLDAGPEQPTIQA